MNSNNAKNNFLLLLCCFILITSFIINYTSVFDLKSGTIKRSSPQIVPPATSIASQAIFFPNSIILPKQSTAQDQVTTYYLLSSAVAPNLFSQPASGYSVTELPQTDGRIYLQVNQFVYNPSGFQSYASIIYDYNNGTIVSQNP